MPDDKKINTVDDGAEGDEGIEELASYISTVAAILEAIEINKK